ncbi:MAG: patatin-like phospholipase family protein [Kiloniellaceae bacterium]
MALSFETVYAAELDAIRERRLDLWRAQRDGGLEPSSTANVGERRPAEENRIANGVPEPAAPKGDDVKPPLIFNKMLEDLRTSLRAFERRRAAARSGAQRSQDEPEASNSEAARGTDGDDDNPPDAAHYGLVGLALSGGGVRSATFCLGAIQALARWDVFPKIDYLSTVSGGGFTGSCISSLYADGNPEFPFRHTPGVPESAVLRHLRNYSNYLAPRGFMDYLKTPGLLLRGILANLLVILPYVIVAAIVTVYAAGAEIRAALQPGGGSPWTGSFAASGWLVLGVLAVLIAYPVAQTAATWSGLSSWIGRNRGNTLLATVIATALLVAVIEFQPAAVYYSAVLWSQPVIRGDVLSLDFLVGVFTALAGLGATVSGKLAPKAHRLTARIALVAIGLLGPIVLWLIYLMLTRWAICGPPNWTKTVADMAGFAPWPVSGALCFSPPFGADVGQRTGSVLTVFYWLAGCVWIYGYFFINVNRSSLHGFYRDRLSRAYLFRRSKAPPERTGTGGEPVAAIAHNDRQLLQDLRGAPIERSFMDRFKALVGSLEIAGLGKTPWRQVRDHLWGHAAASKRGLFVAPYHLINAAINVRRPRTPAMQQANADTDDDAQSHDLRGRKADYFLFSQAFVGSRLTTYCRTEDMHEVDPHLDLGAAMAISGAAAAPNMGTSTVGPLVFIMTMLNVRLGYWLPNPRTVHQRFHPEDANAGDRPPGFFPTLSTRMRRALIKLLYVLRLSSRVGPIYLLLEMLGLLNEEWDFINVSDGGHIENLGLYPLLQRRCRLIIAIDGERDPKEGAGHKFSALATAIRHARIDYGIDVEIDPRHIGRKDGRHFAAGKINYGPDFPSGWLVYIKASLTEDENPYIREYWLKNPTFPHESTGDQFFDETQFECYRALGYHAAEDFLDRAAGEISGDRGLKELFRTAKPPARRAKRRKPPRPVATATPARKA